MRAATALSPPERMEHAIKIASNSKRATPWLLLLIFGELQEANRYLSAITNAILKENP